MSGREGWHLCTHCGEPLADGAIDGFHSECFLRSIVGGLNHLKGLCTCCGGTLPPDPPGMSLREAAKAAALYFRIRENALFNIARKLNHEFGFPWTDPATGVRYYADPTDPTGKKKPAQGGPEGEEKGG